MTARGADHAVYRDYVSKAFFSPRSLALQCEVAVTETEAWLASLSPETRESLFTPAGAQLLVAELQRLTLQIQFRAIFSQSLELQPTTAEHRHHGHGPPSRTLSRLTRAVASGSIMASQMTAMVGRSEKGGGAGGRVDA